MARKKKEVVVEEAVAVATAVPTFFKGYRNPVAHLDGRINVEVEHVQYGWIPFTLCPNCNELTSLEVKAMLADADIKHEELEPCSTIGEFDPIEGRQYRDSELKRADAMVNKIEDGEIEGDSKVWRKYRITLRNWPSTEDFPYVKPVAPDA